MRRVGASLAAAGALAGLVLAVTVFWGIAYDWRIGPLRLRVSDPLRPLIAAAVLAAAALAERRLRVIAQAVLAGCATLALVAYARTADPAFAPAGDIALIESYTIRATEGELVLGPYSRFGWNHPGPLYFFILGPFYKMTGQRSAGLSAGALAINLAALGLAIWVCARAAPRGVLAVALAAAAAAFAWLAAPMLASQWNPHVLVLPTMAVVVLAAAVAAGHAALLPVLAAVASFVVQTHLGLGPAVLAVAGSAAVLLAARTLRGDGSPTRLLWILNATLWLLALLWLMPIVEELSQPEGNLSRLWTFFAQEPRPGQIWRTSFRIWADMISAPVRLDVDVGWGTRYRPTPGPVSQASAIALSLGVALAGVYAARARDAFRTALAGMVLLASAAGLWSIMNIEDDVYDHLVFWLAGIGALHLPVIADAAVQLLPAVPAAFSPRRVAAACLIVFAAAAAVGVQQLRVIVSRSFRPGIEQLAVRRVTDALVPALTSNSRIADPLVTIDQPVWGIAAGVLLQLQKQQIPFSIEEGWRFMFGQPGRPAAGEPTATVIFAGPEQRVLLRERPGHELVAERDRVAIFVVTDHPSPPNSLQ